MSTNRNPDQAIDTGSTPPEQPENQPGALDRLKKIGLWAGGIALVTSTMAAGGLAAIEGGAANHTDIAGVDVSVKPVLGQDYTQIDGAIKRPEHATVLGKPIGLKINGDWNKLTPSDKTTRKELDQIWDDPAPEIARIESTAKWYILEKGAGGAGAVLLAEVLAGAAWQRRRKRYAALGDEEKKVVDRYNAGLRRGTALAGALAVAGLYVAGGSTLMHHDHHVVVGSPSLIGTPLEGTEVSGLANKVLPFYSLLKPKDTFYEEVSNNLEAQLEARPELKKDDNSIVFVVADDFEDVNGMARQVAITAKYLNADFIGYTGDLTFAGNQLETSIIDTINHYSENTPVEFAPGLHDTHGIVNTAEDRDWHVADNETHDVDGIKLMTLADPRISTVGTFGTTDVLRNPDVTVAKFENDMIETACAEKPDIVLGHDYKVLRLLAKTGCVPVIIDGRSFNQLPVQYFTTANGTTAQFTAGSGGGHKTTSPNPGRIQHPATYEVFKLDKQTGSLDYVVITVKPDKSVKISEIRNLAYIGHSLTATKLDTKADNGKYNRQQYHHRELLAVDEDNGSPVSAP